MSTVDRPLAADTEAAADAPRPAAPTDGEMHRRLFEALLDQRLAPGTRLREDELAQTFGVSRTRVRQLLIRLAGEQVVTLTPNAGARVAEPSADEAREVFAARRLVEPELLKGFVARASRQAVAGLARWITEEEQARAQGQRHEAIRRAGGFHLHIAEHAGNATLARFLRELVPRTSLVLMRFGPQQIAEPALAVAAGDAPEAAARLRRRGGGCNCHEHRRVLAAIRLKDAGAAVEAMLAHLARLEAELDFDAPARAQPGLAQLLAP